jgi:hypothetical protein
MKKILKIAFVFALCLPNFVSAQTKQKISLLLHNGKIFTADAQFTTAEAVAVDGEKIVAVGTTKDLRNKYQAAREIDLQGKLVTPGFNDAHVHFLRGALALLNVVLTETKSLAEAQGKIAEKVKTTKTGEWIIGRGWDHTVWGNKFPSRADLDRLRRIIRFIWCVWTDTLRGLIRRLCDWRRLIKTRKIPKAAKSSETRAAKRREF